jgi:hypothetical protein
MLLLLRGWRWWSRKEGRVCRYLFPESDLTRAGFDVGKAEEGTRRLLLRGRRDGRGVAFEYDLGVFEKSGEMRRTFLLLTFTIKVAKRRSFSFCVVASSRDLISRDVQPWNAVYSTE